MTEPLHRTVLMLSAALPRELEGSPRARDVIDLMVALVVEVGKLGGEVVFGAHPTVTPVIYDLIVGRAVPPDAVSLYLPRFFDGRPPAETHDTAVFSKRFVIGTGASPADPDAFAKDLTAMRTAMVERSTAAFFVGGQTSGSLGTVPGLEEEWTLFRAAHPRAPAFVTGVLDGFCRSTLVPDLRAGRRADHTGLSDARRRTLFDTSSVDEAAAIALAALVRP